MGLRTPSDWSTTSRSDQYKQPEPATGLTPKQQDMAGSMYPGAFAPSEPKPKEQGEAGLVEQKRETASEFEQNPEKQQQKREQFQQSGVAQAVAQVSAKLGSFKYQLQDYVNQFLTAPTTKMGVSTYFDPVTGEVKTKETGTALDPAVQQKQAQQQAILGSMSSFLDDTGLGGKKAKKFEDVVAGMTGEGAGTQRLLQMISTLDYLERSGYGSSTEARALQEQIDEMDIFGMGSSLRDAKKNYEQLMGIDPDSSKNIKWYSETGKEGKTAMDLATMQAGDIRKELEKASLAASGLFSGEVESSMKREFDSQSAQAQQASAYFKETNAKYKDALGLILSDEKGEMFKANQTIISALNSPDMQSKIKEALASVPGFEVWGDMLTDGESTYQVLMQAINDPESGLEAPQRALLQKYLGDLGGKGGQFAVMLSSLANTGKFTIQLTEGDPKSVVTVEPDDNTKHQIYMIVANKSMTQEDKAKAVKDTLYNYSMTGTDGIKKTLKEYFSGLVGQASLSGNFETAKATLLKNLNETVGTFMGSKTEALFKEAMAPYFGGKVPETYEEIRAKFLTLPSGEKTKITNQMKEALINSMNQMNTTFNTSMARDGQLVLDQYADKEKQIATTKKNLETKLEEIKAAPATAFNNLISSAKGQIDTSKENILTLQQQILGSDWYKENVATGNIQPVDSYTIASALTYEKFEKLIQQIDPSFGLGVNPLINAFDKTTGKVNIDLIRKYNDNILKYINAIYKEPEKLADAWLANFKMSPSYAEYKSNLDITEAAINKQLGELNTASINLTAGRNTVNTIISQLGENLPVMTSPDELIKGLMTKVTQPQTNVPGMKVVMKDGKPYMSFRGTDENGNLTEKFRPMSKEQMQGYLTDSGMKMQDIPLVPTGAPIAESPNIAVKPEGWIKDPVVVAPPAAATPEAEPDRIDEPRGGEISEPGEQPTIDLPTDGEIVEGYDSDQPLDYLSAEYGPTGSRPVGPPVGIVDEEGDWGQERGGGATVGSGAGSQGQGDGRDSDTGYFWDPNQGYRYDPDEDRDSSDWG